MSPIVRKKKAVSKPASENGRHSSSEEAGLLTVDLRPDVRSMAGLTRTQDRLAAGSAAGQTARSVPRGSTSTQSNERCPAPGL